jgi:Helicase conserved C-terminal domain/Type III restriction enzyme, res subunit
MIRLDEVGIATARSLIDFGGRSAAAQAFAEEQLEGAVALHNLLARQDFAYLADEVGMGKTYVALGTIALMRHFHPDLRVLYIAPRANIQAKWCKEARNFVGNNWRCSDLRVRTFQGTPVVDMVACESLAEFVREVHTNARRDFVLRLPSFSLALRDKDSEGWQHKRRELRALLPWLPEDPLRLHDKDAFKRAYARAVNAALPSFDLVVVDEGHNLKHGYARGSIRNQLLGLVLGRDDPEVPSLTGGGRRSDRVLVLSATPLETDYRELWNQLELFGMGGLAPVLADPKATAQAQQAAAQTFMVRRLTGLEVAGRHLTKNMYRREWRPGGVELHTEPLRAADERERLIVGLVQKKVADVLAAQDRSQGRSFGRRFQMGMLASFESFLETAKVRPGDDETFDQADQTDDPAEREGIDAASIGQLARSHRERFGVSLPHPKMNAVAESLLGALRRGDKSLVFVRRVASVGELVEKVTRQYDDALRDHLVVGAPAALAAEIDREFSRYRRATASTVVDEPAIPRERVADPEDLPLEDDPDEGGSDSFFAWFFRGERELGVRSGAWFRKRRLNDEKHALSTVLDENYLDWLLGADANLDGVAARIGESSEVTRERLRALAYGLFRVPSRRRYPRRRVFRVYQEAALQLLRGARDSVAGRARVMLSVLGWDSHRLAGKSVVPTDFPPPDEVLRAETLFTILRRHPLGRGPLQLDRTTPPEGGDDFAEFVRHHENVRELLGQTIALGYPFVELWRAYVGHRGSMLSKAAEPSAVELAHAFLDRLSAPLPGLPAAVIELASIVEHLDLILDVNFPAARTVPLPRVPQLFLHSLSSQTPIAGMSGRINGRLVEQFRLPGYPHVLVTTDVLQEGEDLHTFAARVMHYGIAWTPSAMEQRTGRVDRIGSLVHRRLRAADTADPEAFLQIQFPYLDATVELFQVREIFRRMDEFVALLHQGLGADEARQSAIRLSSAIHERAAIREPSLEPLKSPFRVDDDLLHRNAPAASAVSESELARYETHFTTLLDELGKRILVEWDLDSPRRGRRLGTVWVREHDLTGPEPGPDSRQQPFALHLSSGGGGLAFLTAISPIGVVRLDDDRTVERLFGLQTRLPTAKLCAVVDAKRCTYNLSAQVDVLFHPDTLHVEEVLSAVRRCTVVADVVENEVLGTDLPLSRFVAQLHNEVTDA